jgi:hypothetical protein
MMQLIHSRKALETDPIAYMQELQEFQLLWKRCLPSKDPTYSTKIKLPSSSKLKTMVKKPWMEGRLEYTMLPDGTITG